MKLFKVSQNINVGWDTYNSMVVVAESEGDTRTIHPEMEEGTEYTTISVKAGNWYKKYNGDAQGFVMDTSTWVEYSDRHRLKVEYLGETTHERGVILASFNAG